MQKIEMKSVKFACVGQHSRGDDIHCLKVSAKMVSKWYQVLSPVEKQNSRTVLYWQHAGEKKA